jgi:hypothetical protein
MPRLPQVPALAPVGQIPEGQVVDLPGRGSTYVIDSGPSDGPTYMLLHSLACTGLMTWYPTLDMVQEFGRVVLFDQRCHGQGISPPRMLLELLENYIARAKTAHDVMSEAIGLFMKAFALAFHGDAAGARGAGNAAADAGSGLLGVFERAIYAAIAIACLADGDAEAAWDAA